MPYGGNEDTDPADAIRAIVGDTNASIPKLGDNAYVLILATESTFYSRAALAARMCAGLYATEMNKRVGDLWRDAKVQYEHYKDLADSLEATAKRRTLGTPFAGGISKADDLARATETDRVQPQFETGMLDNTTSPDVVTIDYLGQET